LKIVVNGNEKEFENSITVEQLLKELSLDGKVMAAAVNMNIVKQDSWDKHILVDGDKLELLDFVGGG
jgi:sulfur carrier protein